MDASAIPVATPGAVGAGRMGTCVDLAVSVSVVPILEVLPLGSVLKMTMMSSRLMMSSMSMVVMMIQLKQMKMTYVDHFEEVIMESVFGLDSQSESETEQ